VRSIGDPEGGTFRKEAETAADRERLRREAEVLTAVAHPGLVRLIATEGGDLPEAVVFGLVEGTDLSRMDVEDPTVLAGIGAAVATALADIHDLGLVHSAITAAHVLIDAEGRPVLCGFGSSSYPDTPALMGELAREDTAALASMLLSRLPSAADAAVRATLRTAAGQGGRSRRADARWLASQLVRRVPGARLAEPGSRSESLVDTHRLDLITPVAPARRRRGLTSVLVVGLLAMGIGLAIFGLRSGGSSPHPPATGDRCPRVDYSCRPVGWPGGIITTAQGRFRVAAPPGSIVVLGRWNCSDQALPAVVERSSGDVWLFDSWPGPGHSRTARLVARVRSISNLAVIPTQAGCDLLRITRTGAGPLTVRPSRP
jgi:tRNA A-37 threonylcarbamoyl transferase component Bud32